MENLKNLFFVSGLPRSGSTLLMNLLGQNPNHYVTPTSGLIELFCGVKSTWKNCLEFKSEGLEKVKPRVAKSMAGILHGYFYDELSQGKVVFDKSRGWPQFMEDLEYSMGREIRIISTVRDIRAVVASFEKLYRKREIEYTYPQGDAFFEAQTVVGRAEVLLGKGGVIGLTINRIRDALNRMPSRMVIIPYQSFTINPKQTMNALHERLGLEPFDYDPENIEQVTHENDLYHGMDLHTINGKIVPPQTNAKPPWDGILPPQYANELAQRYQDINQLAAM